MTFDHAQAIRARTPASFRVPITRPQAHVPLLSHRSLGKLSSDDCERYANPKLRMQAFTPQ
jgi:hypothetical protein